MRALNMMRGRSRVEAGEGSLVSQSKKLIKENKSAADGFVRRISKQV
jgi:hypothetical protein